MRKAEIYYHEVLALTIEGKKVRKNFGALWSPDIVY